MEKPTSPLPYVHAAPKMPVGATPPTAGVETLVKVVVPSWPGVTLIRWIWFGAGIDQKNPLEYVMSGPAEPTPMVVNVLVRRFTLVSVEPPLLPT